MVAPWIPTHEAAPESTVANPAGNEPTNSATTCLAHRIPADAVIVNPERAAELKDSLFELRCAAEDIEVAATEGASAAESSELCQELVRLARSIEHLR